MNTTVLLAICDAALREELWNALETRLGGGELRIEVARDVEGAEERHREGLGAGPTLLVIEAELRSRRGMSREDELEGLELLGRWRDSGDFTPAVLVTTSASISVLKGAAGIPSSKVVVVDGEVLQTFDRALGSLRGAAPAAGRASGSPGGTPLPAGTTVSPAANQSDRSAVVELNLMHGSPQRYDILLDFDGQEVTYQGELQVDLRTLDNLKKEVQVIRKLKEDWEVVLRRIGETIYDEICRGSFSQHYHSASGAVGDRERMNIRFTVDPSFFPVPFEAMHDKFNYCMLESAVARRIHTTEPTRASELQANQSLRMLFIKADVGHEDALDVPPGGTWKTPLPTFETLANLDREQEGLEAIVTRLAAERSSEVSLDVIDKTGLEGGARTFKALVKEALVDSGKSYDIVHFAGHSTTVDGGSGSDDSSYLILPGIPYAEPLAASEFARWLKKAGVKVAFLSACHSTDADAARALADRGVPVVVGFRWDLEDDFAADYAREFYEGVLLRRERYVEAFREARRRMRTDHGERRIWAAATLIVQSRKWHRSGFTSRNLH